MDTLEYEWVNPMAMEDIGMVCLSTGRLASEDIVHDLLNAYDLGETAYQKFKQERVESEDSRSKFHDRIGKKKLKTFTNMTKPVKIKTKG